MLFKKVFLSVVVFIFGFGFTSCHTDKFEKQYKQIDSLVGVLDTAYNKLNELDTSVVQSYYETYTQNIKHIKDNFDEKNDDEVWRVITRYGLIRKPLRDFKKHYINYSEEIEFSKSQLTNLKADIKNNILTEDLIEQYIKEEAEFVNYLNLSVGGLMEITNNYYQQYLELNPLVEKFINEKKI